jgi:DNA-binding transcriptional LysR family regulator
MHDTDVFRIFLTVVQEGSFSGAAKRLHLTQPAVSFQMAALEEHYKAPLFDRGPRGVTLTESGRVVYEYAIEIVRLVANSEQDVAELRGMVRGNLILGAGTVPGEYILPQYLGRFSKLYPGVVVSLKVSGSGVVKDMVLDGTVDLGVVGARFSDEKLVCADFLPDELKIIVPAGHQLLSQKAVKPEDLLNYTFVMREPDSGTRLVFQKALKTAGVKPENIQIGIITGSTQAVKTAVEAGLGISVVSGWAIQKEVAMGTLAVIDVEGLNLRREFYLIRRAGGPRTFAASRFWEEVLSVKRDELTGNGGDQCGQ